MTFSFFYTTLLSPGQLLALSFSSLKRQEDDDPKTMLGSVAVSVEGAFHFLTRRTHRPRPQSRFLISAFTEAV